MRKFASYLLTALVIGILVFPAPAFATQLNFISASNQTTSSSYNFTVAAGTNSYLLLSVMRRGGSTISATFNGVAMANLGNSGGHVNAGDTEYIFGLVAPTTGSRTLAITHDGSSVFSLVAQYDGVNQTTPTEGCTTAFGTGASTPTITVTPTKSDWIVGGMWQNNGTPTAAAGSSLRNAGTANNAIIVDSASNQTAAYSIGTSNTSTSFDAVACGLIDADQPVAAAAPTLINMSLYGDW